MRAAPPGMVKFFKYNHRGSLSEQDTVAAPVERAIYLIFTRARAGKMAYLMKSLIGLLAQLFNGAC
jgi:hypothetical protein